MRKVARQLASVGTSTLGRTAAEALIDGLAALEAVLDGVPMLNRGLAHPPAKQHDLIIDAARKIEQAGIYVLDLNTDGVDLLNALAHALQVRIHLAALFACFGKIHAHSPAEINTPG